MAAEQRSCRTAAAGTSGQVRRHTSRGRLATEWGDVYFKEVYVCLVPPSSCCHLVLLTSSSLLLSSSSSSVFSLLVSKPLAGGGGGSRSCERATEKALCLVKTRYLILLVCNRSCSRLLFACHSLEFPLGLTYLFLCRAPSCLFFSFFFFFILPSCAPPYS